MPKQKDLKRLVRSRMEKTGESYTAARAQLIRKKTASKAVPASGSVSASAPATAPAPDLAKIAGMSDEAVRGKTGKSWAQWVWALDSIGAASMPHRDIATHVREAHRIDAWWAQGVTVGYERIKGLRERGQRRDGRYECTKSRTFPVTVDVLYRAFASAAVRRKWLGGIDLRVRKATPSRSVRIAWPDGTHVEVGLAAKGEKSQAAIQHTKLPSKEEALRLKTWWSDRFDVLAEILRP